MSLFYNLKNVISISTNSYSWIFNFKDYLSESRIEVRLYETSFFKYILNYNFRLKFRHSNRRVTSNNDSFFDYTC